MEHGNAETGFTLIAPFNKKNVYLVDYNGDVVHTWRSNRNTKGTVELFDNGTLLRGRSGVSGQADGLQILDWDGSVLWDYTPPAEFDWHHDIEPMPNGNVLITAVVDYQDSDVVDLGRDPDLIPGHFRVEPVIEIRPNGTYGGDVVWMWDPVDHLIQDFDPSKPNYGVVGDHPELIDVNYPEVYSAEWQHSNSVSYNPELDQMIITNRNFDEFWVIDHNTTMEEAAGHSGGAHGKGGDILYRWGNPQAFGAGNASDHMLYGPHDAHWIGPGLPGEGNILIFNNGNNLFMTRPEGRISTVEEMSPPINETGGYDLTTGSAYGPSDSIWRYNGTPPEDFFVWSMGGAERLPDGNTLICGGNTGLIFEIDTDNEVVWEYEGDSTFKASRYYPPALEWVPDVNATEDVLLRVDISPYISDLDTDDHTLVIGENSTFANVSGHELVLQYPEGITTDVINLTVSDGTFEVGKEVRVNITPVNDPPVLLPIPDVEALEDVPYELDLTVYVSDPDTNISVMKIDADSPYVTLEGEQLGFLYPNGVLTDRVLLSVSDGEFEDRTEIQVIVKPVNDPPSVDPIPDQQGVEDVPWTIDLGKYIRDIDNPIEDISMTSISQYTTVAGFNLSFLYPEGVTRDLVVLTVTDGKSAPMVRINVTIEPVNDPPEITGLPPLTVKEDEPFSLDLDPSIIDVDTPLEELILRVDSPFVDVDGHVLVLLYPEGGLVDELVVEVWDGGLQASTTLVVNVQPVNDAPTIDNVPALTVEEDVPYTLDLGPLISDTDTPFELLTLRVDSPFISVEGHSVVLLYPNGISADQVVVEVWDGELSSDTILVVNVEPVNDPPWWSDLPDLAAVEDVEGEFDLGPYMNDVDSPLGELAVEANSSHGSVQGHVFKYVYPEGVLDERVSFTLTDGELQAVLVVDVQVTPVNDAPELSMAKADPSEGGRRITYKFTVVYKDVDMGSTPPVVEVVVDDTSYSCERDGSVGGTYEEGVVYTAEIIVRPGVHSVYFNADDGDGGMATTEPLTVTVKETPDSGGGPDLMMILVFGIVIAVVIFIDLLMTRRRLY